MTLYACHWHPWVTKCHSRPRRKVTMYWAGGIARKKRDNNCLLKSFTSTYTSSGLGCRGYMRVDPTWALKVKRRIDCAMLLPSQVTQTFRIFTISSCPIGAYHTRLSITLVSNTPSQLPSSASPSSSLHIVIQFTHELTETYNQHGTRIDHLDPSTTPGCSHLPTLHYTPYLGHQ